MGYQGSDKHKIKLWELFTKKQDKLTAGENVSLTPLQDGTVKIDVEAGSGDVVDVEVDGTSVLDENGVAHINTMTGATSQENGAKGLVPAPTSADKDKVLKGDGTWGEAGGNVDDVMVNGTSVVDPNKVAQVKAHKEITQAEYDALPASKLTDGILYCIKDSGIVEGNQFAPVIYSLEEREIGTWVDGKPVYQKSYAYEGTISQDIWFDLGLVAPSDLSEVVDSSYTIRNSSGTIWSVNGNNYSSQKTCIRVSNSDHKILFYSTGDSWSNAKVYLTIRYTKTTDTPGSGSWGVDGVPMVHFDDTEKIVGTWFGKTLYEKTIAQNNIPVGYYTQSPQVQTQVAHGVSNLDEAVYLQIACPKLGIITKETLFTNGAVMADFRINDTYIQAIAGNNFFGASADRYWYFTIRYTKSS